MICSFVHRWRRLLERLLLLLKYRRSDIPVLTRAGGPVFADLFEVALKVPLLRLQALALVLTDESPRSTPGDAERAASGVGGENGGDGGDGAGEIS